MARLLGSLYQRNDTNDIKSCIINVIRKHSVRSVYVVGSRCVGMYFQLNLSGLFTACLTTSIYEIYKFIVSQH